MKKVLLVLIVILAVGFGVYKAAAMVQTKEAAVMTDKKVLIAYYSRSGNTKAVAQKIQSVTGGDLFEIKPLKPYPKDYDTMTQLVQKEKQQDIRPELADNGNIKDYDVVFVGTPVWWYTLSSPVKTFLTKNDFSGKTIVPFCTHGGGGASSTYADMQKLAPNAKVTEGYASYENSADTKEIIKWIDSLKL